MRAPRRIFRSQSKLQPTLIRPLLAGAAAVVAAVATAGLSSSLFGRTPPVPDGISADPAHVVVIDGETLRLGRQVIRLRGIEAPPRGGVCSGGWDCGSAAASALAALVRDRRVDCRLTGRDGQGRPVAACDAAGEDLSGAIVAGGWARAASGAQELADLERLARRQRIGLWAAQAN